MINILVCLCLIFALFAGLVSGVNEMLAQTLGMRGKILYEGIALLLGDLTSQSPLLYRLGIGKLDKNNKFLTTDLFKHPLIKTLSQPGSKPSYIAPTIFSAALVQVLSTDGSLKLLSDKLKDRTDHNPLGKLFGPMLDQANGDIDKFKAQVEAHFNLVMDRVGGWYKRRSQAVMFLLAIFLAISLNVDTLYIAQNLQSNPELVAKLVKTAEALNESVAKDTAPNELPNDTDQIASLKTKIDDLKQQISDFQETGLPIGWDLPEANPEQKNLCYYLFRLIGWLLTALAATLGAPFWFDAISKLLSVRGAGKKPEDSPTVTGTTLQVNISPALQATRVDSAPKP